MNIHVDTLEYANDLQRAGIERAHAEAIARLQAKTVTDLVDHELVTRDALKSELTQLEARLKVELAQQEARSERRMDMQMLQIRSLQMGGAIAAFALGAVVMHSRLIK